MYLTKLSDMLITLSQLPFSVPCIYSVDYFIYYVRNYLILCKRLGKNYDQYCTPAC